MRKLPCLVSLLPVLLGAAASAASAPQLLPLPKTLTLGEGVLTLNQDSRIVADSADLEPLAKLLASEIQQTTGVSISTEARKPSGAGVGARPMGYHYPVDIVLRLEPKLKGEAYTLDAEESVTPISTTGGVTIAGGSYQSVASATVTLLQAVHGSGSSLTIPKMHIADEPVYAYRGALIDLARKYHTPGGIEQVIELCRMYKVRYLHLNLADDQLFMFASSKFPQLGKSNHEFARFEPGSQPHCKPYTLEQLQGLEAYAKLRGVYLVPEINFPGHCGRLIADAPEVFGLPGNGSTVHIANPKTLAAVSVLLNEMMDVFQSTPYIHLGADEVGLGGLEQTPEYKQLQTTTGIKSAHDLYCKFIADLNTLVTKRGKKSIVWEEACNPGGTYPLPKDVTVMAWTHGRSPADIAKAGYPVINAMWTPLYIVRGDKRPLEFLFKWKLPMFGRGHLGDDTFTTLTDTTNILGTQICSWENAENIEIQSLRDRLALVAEKAWNPTAVGTLTEFKARLAHTDPLLDLLVNPIAIQVEGSFTQDENTFADPLTITLVPRVAGLTLKYTLDNSLPNSKWQEYSAPIKATETVHLRAGLFDGGGVQQGHLVGSWFNHKKVIKANLATGKPATAGPPPDPGNGKSPSIAVDGKADNADDYWDGGEGPHWLQVDLQKAQPVRFINVITYWDGGRYYQLNAEVSVDGKQWKKVLDFSKNTVPATAAGYSGKFEPTEARYVRVNMLKNSANPSVHIVELIVE